MRSAAHCGRAWPTHGVYPTLNGKAEVLLENGRILKAKERAVWKIISLLNLLVAPAGQARTRERGVAV